MGPTMAAPAAANVASRATSGAGKRFLQQASLFLALLLCAIAAQLLVSGYSRPMGAESDEPGHFLSSLLIRDYVLAGMPSTPLEYATQYYTHHPGIAIGYWPPLFYVVAGFWMILFGISHTSMLVLSAVICASLQYLIFWFGSREFGRLPAFAIAALFPMIGGVTQSITTVMTDVFLALWSLAATISFGYLLAKPTTARAIRFGLLLSAALLAKAGAVHLLLVPLFAIVASRRFEVLRQRVFWVPALVVGALYGPWLAFTHPFATRGLLPGGGGTPFFSAWAQYANMLLRLAGPVMLVLAIVAAAAILLRAASPVWCAIAAQPLCFGLILALSPVSIGKRYAITALPSVLLLGIYGVRMVLQRTRSASYLPLVLAPVLATTLMADGRRLLPVFHGLDPAVDFLVRSAHPDSVILVSSEAAPEVLMVAEIARRETERPGRLTLRANKLLAATDWNMTWYSLRFQTPEQVLEELQRGSVDLILVSSPSGKVRSLPHHDLLLRALKTAPEQWQLAYGAGETAGSPYHVYKLSRRAPVSNAQPPDR